MTPRMVLARSVAILLVMSGTATAQIAPSMERESGTHLVFPAVIKFIYDGDFDVVPDDATFRRYIVSVYKGIYDACEPNGRGIGLAAGYYAFPEARRLRDEPGAAVGDFWRNLFGGLATMSRGDIVGGLSGMTPARMEFNREGLEDGTALVKTNKCNSIENRTLRAQIERLIGQNQGNPTQEFDQLRYSRLMHPQWRTLLGATEANPSVRIPTAAEERVLLRRREAEARRRALEEERAVFERARNAHDVGAIRSYLNRYGSKASYVREARAALDVLDQRAFEMARSRNTLESYRQYLLDFPAGQQRAQADEAIGGFDDVAFRAASGTNTEASYAHYLEQFPEGRNRQSANNALAVLDRASYDRARRLGSIAAYEAYLQSNPMGRHRSQAQSWISLTTGIAQSRRAARALQGRESAARTRATGFGVMSIAALGGTAFLGYGTYDKAMEYKDLSDAAHEGETSDESMIRKEAMEEKAKGIVLYGAGTVVTLALSKAMITRLNAQRRAAGQLREERRRIEDGIRVDEQRMQNLGAQRMWIEPLVDLRRGVGVRVTLAL